MLLFCTFLYVVVSFLSANSHLPSQRVPVNCCAKGPPRPHLQVPVIRKPLGGSTLRAERSQGSGPSAISKATCSRSALFRLLCLISAGSSSSSFTVSSATRLPTLRSMILYQGPHSQAGTQSFLFSVPPRPWGPCSEPRLHQPHPHLAFLAPLTSYGEAIAGAVQTLNYY